MVQILGKIFFEKEFGEMTPLLIFAIPKRYSGITKGKVLKKEA
jgi:hypothetical protein